jgi:hypothetical protein
VVPTRSLYHFVFEENVLSELARMANAKEEIIDFVEPNDTKEKPKR